MLSYDEVMRFNTFGFMVLRGLFSQDEVTRIKREFHEIMAEAVNNFAPRRPFLAGLIDDDRIYGIAEGILGHDFVYEGSGGHLWVGDTRWHGGAGSLVKWPLPHIKVSMYLEPVGKDTGCLRFIPGSHRNYLRHIDRAWAHAPDYMEFLRAPSIDPDHKPYGLEPSEIPAVPVEAEPGDVIVHTEDILHATFGGSPGRPQLALAFVANPTTEQHLYYLRQRYAWSGNGELRPPRSYLNSDSPRVRRMVSKLTELGFEPIDP